MARRGRPRKDGTTGDQTDINVLYQIKKATVLGGQLEVVFKNGDKVAIHPNTANLVWDYYSSLVPVEKEKVQDFIAESYENFISFVQNNISVP